MKANVYMPLEFSRHLHNYSLVVNFCKYINNTIQYVNEGLDACYFPVDMPVHYIYQQSIKSIT